VTENEERSSTWVLFFDHSQPERQTVAPTLREERPRGADPTHKRRGREELSVHPPDQATPHLTLALVEAPVIKMLQHQHPQHHVGRCARDDPSFGCPGEQMLKGVRKSQESRGRRFENARHEPADIPAPGSLRLSGKIVAPETTLHFTAYVLAARRIYSIQLFSEPPKEPDSFVAFVRSFKLIVPVATSATAATAPPSEVGFVVMMFIYVAILVISMGGGLLVNAIVGRPVVSGGLLAIVSILAVVTLRVYHDPGEQTLAERFGYHLAQALLPALVALWGHSHHLKNKAQASRFGA
jgi:hypothetical protein